MWHSYGYNRSNGPILFAESAILIHTGLVPPMHTTPMKQQRTGQIKQIWFNLIWTRAESSSTDKTGVFFGGFCLFFATSFAGRNAHRKDIPKKQTNPVCFVLRQESPIQRSATPAWQVGDNFCDHPLFRDRPNLII